MEEICPHMCAMDDSETKKQDFLQGWEADCTEMEDKLNGP